MPLNSAGNFGGPQYGWGDAQGGHARGANSGFDRGRHANSPGAGLHRGEWQWRGHGPGAQQSYGWDYQGGVGRDEITQRSEARMGSPFQARMAQERSGGLPQGRYAVDYDRLGERAGRGGGDVGYDWGWQGRTGGMDRGENRYGATDQRYGGDFRASGIGWTGSGSRQMGGGYGATSQRYGNDFRGGGGGAAASGNRQMSGGYGASGGWMGGGMPSRGGYGRDFQAGGGTGGSMRGRYGGDYSQPLSDAEFYRRVERW